MNARQVYQALRPLIDEALQRARGGGGSSGSGKPLSRTWYVDGGQGASMPNGFIGAAYPTLEGACAAVPVPANANDALAQFALLVAPTANAGSTGYTPAGGTLTLPPGRSFTVQATSPTGLVYSSATGVTGNVVWPVGLNPDADPGISSLQWLDVAIVGNFTATVASSPYTEEVEAFLVMGSSSPPGAGTQLTITGNVNLTAAVNIEDATFSNTEIQGAFNGSPSGVATFIGCILSGAVAGEFLNVVGTFCQQGVTSTSSIVAYEAVNFDGSVSGSVFNGPVSATSGNVVASGATFNSTMGCSTGGFSRCSFPTANELLGLTDLEFELCTFGPGAASFGATPLVYADGPSAHSMMAAGVIAASTSTIVQVTGGESGCPLIPVVLPDSDATVTQQGGVSATPPYDVAPNVSNVYVTPSSVSSANSYTVAAISTDEEGDTIVTSVPSPLSEQITFENDGAADQVIFSSDTIGFVRWSYNGTIWTVQEVGSLPVGG
jgi:hypothetical protein